MPPTRDSPELQGGVEAISAALPGGYGEPHRQDSIIAHAPADRNPGRLHAARGGGSTPDVAWQIQAEDSVGVDEGFEPRAWWHGLVGRKCPQQRQRRDRV
jgi:hypothetical protein